MSADNGVYILKTKDKQYRVKEIRGVDYLYRYGSLDSERVFEEFKDIKYTYCKANALLIASSILERLPICEYGISFITSDKTWNKFVKDAKLEKSLNEYPAEHLGYEV